MSLHDPSVAPDGSIGDVSSTEDQGRPPMSQAADGRSSVSPTRVPTSAEIDAVIAAAMANAPPPPPPPPDYPEPGMNRSVTPLMTNLLPSAVGIDGRVNLFVGNLPYRVRWQDLKDLFRKAGTVLRADVSLGPDNRSRGYGTVLMGSREDAARAIDRYNGFTWQTRTLEVRPDRLPPEYEPQNQQQQLSHGHGHQHQHQHQHLLHHPLPHHPHAQPLHRPAGSGMFNFHNIPPTGQPYPLGAHPNGAGGHWMPNQTRQSFSAGPVNGLLGPGIAPPMGMGGSNPISSSQSPPTMYGSASLPLSVQNTGGPPYPHLAASPLAGSLTAGTGATGASHVSAPRRDSQTPFSHHASPDPIVSLGKSASPALAQAQTSSIVSRPNSTNDSAISAAASPPVKDGSAMTIPPALLHARGSIHGIDLTGSDIDLGRRSPAISASRRGSAVPPIPQLEGLAHQGTGLGPPSTLHDRVIFVSNLPLSMQWQDLKDLLRPAGTIIRADVATDGNGRPRGFGTALFASEGDAARAVGMFNGCDIGGQRISAHLERERRLDSGLPHDNTKIDVSALGFTQDGHQNDKPTNGPTGLSAEIDPLAPIDTQTSPTTDSRRPSQTSPAAKLPWSLNTSLQHQTPGRPGPTRNGNASQNNTPGPHQHTPNFRQLHHPGPISMPSYPALDQNNPLSPLQTRGLPPMTPSMPGFVFNTNAYPETPPVHPHFMSMSPGIGPFSPGIPVTSPNAFGYNPFINAAPGAPISRYPGPGQQGGSAALGTPTTQAFPGDPHHYAGAPGAGQQMNISQTLSSSQGYFPAVPAPDSPTVKLTTRAVGQPSAQPLNAKDRLAESTDEQTLIKGTNAITFNGDDAAGELTPPAPRGIMGGGRQSLDETRTLAPGLSVGAIGERRASFNIEAIERHR
ncbi:hypothetical protein IAU60_000269 [Kwoniella sp. DSM 27419]